MKRRAPPAVRSRLSGAPSDAMRVSAPPKMLQHLKKKKKLIKNDPLVMAPPLQMCRAEPGSRCSEPTGPTGTREGGSGVMGARGGYLREDSGWSRLQESSRLGGFRGASLPLGGVTLATLFLETLILRI